MINGVELNMHAKLKKAINAGKNELKARQQAALDETKAATELEQQRYNEHVTVWIKTLTETNYIYDLIKAAVAKGEDVVNINAGPELVTAIGKTFTDIYADYNSGYDYINSDDIKEFWQYVRITWKK